MGIKEKYENKQERKLAKIKGDNVSGTTVMYWFTQLSPL